MNTIIPQVPQGATDDERRAIYFDTLYNLNVNDKVEKKDNLTYLSWAYAWAEFKKIYPSATYRIIMNPDTHLPYFQDSMGIITMTEVTADDLTYQMWLPVMDSKNKAMKSEPYSYQVWDNYSKQYVEKTVAAATAFDINKTIMRCLVKNLAMYGMGLYIYAGEDLPEAEGQQNAPVPQQQPQQQKRQYTRRTPAPVAQPQPQTAQSNRYQAISNAINSCQTVESLTQLYYQHIKEIQSDPTILALFTERKNQLTQAA